ncbi:hypothetical protein HY768_02755 [candidate division TA06 bacterium]|uniref:Chemotaxis protein n=1 Tax=candidate division TA06 bacterium TaxID=2250710 RepID=A0A933MIZ4_UNCT6|nr:hypothetical protein [candidate division TA06 bacterium]
MNKIAIAVIHGIGEQKPDFADEMTIGLREQFVKQDKKRLSGAELCIKPVYWAPLLQKAEDNLWRAMLKGGTLDFISLRRFMINFAADAIAYQPAGSDREVYDQVHGVFAQSLRGLAEEAGEKAPLCIIAHSLGTVIASNYIYDLQAAPKKKLIPETVKSVAGATPIEKGETLCLFYTLGSPIAIWSLRYADFGVPVAAPDPRLAKHYPNIAGEWVNFYDRDDVIGYPLKNLNSLYNRAVKQDVEINAGGFLSSWNPLSHLGYLTDGDALKPMAQGLYKAWAGANG